MASIEQITPAIPSPSSRPRVLQVVTHLALGGAPSVALSLASGLRNEFDFAVCAVNGVIRDGVGEAMQAELAAQRIPLFVGPRLAIKRGGLLLAGLALLRAVRRFRPDVIHLHTEIPEASYATMITLSPGVRRIPIIRTIHNSVYWRYWPRIGRWCDRRIGRCFVIAISRDARDEFLRYRNDSRAGPLLQEPVIIYNGVASPRRVKTPGRDPGRVRVLFGGRFEFQKGTDLLPAIFSRVRPRGNLIGEASLFGSGAHEPMLRALAADPPPGWNVHVHPPVAGLAERMADFDLVIVPSRFEGLALVAIEAALCGVPIVGTDAPGLREVLPERHPWRAPAGDAEGFARCLQAAIDAPEAWPAAVEEARQLARVRFNPATALAEHARWYARVAGRPG
jgi:glycosyltransferase involved in cell wall biosynthesis